MQRHPVCCCCRCCCQYCCCLQQPHLLLLLPALLVCPADQGLLPLLLWRLHGHQLVLLHQLEGRRGDLLQVLFQVADARLLPGDNTRQDSRGRGGRCGVNLQAVKLAVRRLLGSMLTTVQHHQRCCPHMSHRSASLLTTSHSCLTHVSLTLSHLSPAPPAVLLYQGVHGGSPAALLPQARRVGRAWGFR